MELPVGKIKIHWAFGDHWQKGGVSGSFGEQWHGWLHLGWPDFSSTWNMS